MIKQFEINFEMDILSTVSSKDIVKFSFLNVDLTRIFDSNYLKIKLKRICFILFLELKIKKF